MGKAQAEGRGMFHALVFGRVLPLCAILALSLSLAPPSGAAVPHEVHAVPAPHALIKEDLEAFFDGIIPLQLERSDVAGAAVLVMRGGETLLQKGYGFSDLKAVQLVDPQSTMFRLASAIKESCLPSAPRTGASSVSRVHLPPRKCSGSPGMSGTKLFS